MTTLADAVSDFPMPSLTQFKRTAQETQADPYSGEMTVSKREPVVEFSAALASSSSTRTAQETGQTIVSDAVLTIPGQGVDLRPGDMVSTVPDDGRKWRVTGYPSMDVSPFTGWRPTTEARLEEVRGA